jgi:hypothetical protein
MVKVPGVVVGAKGTLLRPSLNKKYKTFNLPLGKIKFKGKEKWLPELNNFIADYKRPYIKDHGKYVENKKLSKYQSKIKKNIFFKKVASPLAAANAAYKVKNLSIRGFVYEDKHPILYKMSQIIGLADPQMIIMLYKPGSCALIHTDTHGGWDIYDPRKKKNNYKSRNRNLQRVMVQLDDHAPGMFMQWDNQVWNKWSAGDVNAFDERYWHSAANASTSNRWVLRVTGGITEKFKKFLKMTEISL